MKYIFLLFIATLSCAAQEIQVKEMPAADVLKYLNIDPDSVSFLKFQVTFPSARFGALEFREIVSGKENLEMHNIISVEPAKVFEIEIFVTPFSQVESKTYRNLYYKISNDVKSGVSSLTAVTSFQIHENWKAEVGPKIPMIFKSSSGNTVDTLTFISSNTPITKQSTEISNKTGG